MVQGKDTLNKKQRLPCWRWWNRTLFFIHLFMRLVRLLLLYCSVKIAIPHYHLFLLLQILHLFLFKFLQRLGDLSISGDSRVLFWWDRYGNLGLSFLKRFDLPFVRNVFFAIYFWPIFVRQFRKVVLLVLQQCGDDCVLSVAGEQLSRYRAVPLTSYMVRNVNENVNVDLCSTI